MQVGKISLVFCFFHFVICFFARQTDRWIVHLSIILYNDELYPPVLKISGYNGYNECKEPDIHSETQKGNGGNLTEIHC